MKFRIRLAALAGYLIITAVYFFPIMTSPGSHVIGDRDSFYFLWDIWWFKHSLLGMRGNPLITNMIFYPLSEVHAFWSSPINELAGALMSCVAGPVLTFNVLMVISFPLTGWLMFMYLQNTIVDILPSFIGGFIFSFSTYHCIHVNQIGLATIQWIPLFLIALARFQEKPCLRRWLLLLPAAWLVALSDPYTFVYFLVYFLIYLAFYRPCTSATLLVLIPLLIGPFYLPMAGTLSSITGAHDLTVETVTYSQDILKYVIPWKFHPLWGGFFSGFFPGDRLIEMYPGYIVFFLSGFALWKAYSPSFRGKGKTHPPSPLAGEGRVRGNMRFWFIFGLIALVLSLGPYLKVNGATGIPMPYWLIWKFPFLSFLRMPQRFGLEVGLALSIFSAYGFKEILGRRAGARGSVLRYIIAFLFLAGIAIETLVYFPYPASDARIPRLYEFLRETSDKGALLELPIGNEDDIYRYMYYQTMHGKKLVNGGLPRNPDGALDFMKDTPFLQELGDPQSLMRGDIIPKVLLSTGASLLSQSLANTGISFIVLHKDPYTGTDVEKTFEEVLGSPFFEDPEVAGYTVRTLHPSPRTPLSLSPMGRRGGEGVLVLGKGWYELGVSEGHPYRWMERKGEIKIVGNPGVRAARLRISAIRHFPRAKTLMVSLNGKLLEDMDISAISYKGVIVTRPFHLPRGDSCVSITVKEGAFSPWIETGVPDPRRIGIGISQIEIIPP